MKDLQASEVRAIAENAKEAIDLLERIVKECDGMYSSRRYIIDKVTNAMIRVNLIASIATEEPEHRAG